MNVKFNTDGNKDIVDEKGLLKSAARMNMPCVHGAEQQHRAAHSFRRRPLHSHIFTHTLTDTHTHTHTHKLTPTHTHPPFPSILPPHTLSHPRTHTHQTGTHPSACRGDPFSHNPVPEYTFIHLQPHPSLAKHGRASTVCCCGCRDCCRASTVCCTQ